jgi:hypothetical protein
VNQDGFLLGTHEVTWLGKAEFSLFMSHRRLMKRKSYPVAIKPWALDSGAFSALSAGGWDMTEAQYLAAVRRYSGEIGNLMWAAPMDWMCEPQIRAKTGKTVQEHLGLTVTNYLSLREQAPELNIIPSLQGWDLDDYKRCADLYDAAGVDLAALPLAGLGSVCRRQSTEEIALIVKTFASQGVRLHGFGVKTLGLALYGKDLVSSDSMAWSYDARRADPLPGCTTHINCANCILYARRWRQRLLAGLSSPQDGCAALSCRS